MRGSFRIRPDGKYEVVLTDQPDNFHALKMAPSEMEPELSQGLWLVLHVAVWSGTDQAAIEVALELAEEFKGQLEVGVRPFDSHEEIRCWLPDVSEQYRSPIWLILREGKKLCEKVGLSNKDAVKRWVIDLISEASGKSP
jgi:hypothetical protein